MNRRTDDRASAETDARANWLSEHGIELLVVATSMFTAACFCIGRANLMGWYDAAGIPALTFSWAPQDLVIRGFFKSRTWWVLIASIGGALLYFGSLAILGFAYRTARSRWRSTRLSRWLSGNFVDSLRDGKADEASESGVSCELVAESVERPQTEGAATVAKRRDVAVLAIALIVFLLAVTLFLACNKLFFLDPYAEGVDSFRAQFIAATGHAPPTRVPVAEVGKQAVGKLVMSRAEADASAIGHRQLEGYAFVEVSGIKDGGSSDPRACGWLVQSSGNQVLLITVEGISMTNFGDGAFAWRMVDPKSCSLPRFSARAPEASPKNPGGASAAGASGPVGGQVQSAPSR